jgi:hypothetical protein
MVGCGVHVVEEVLVPHDNTELRLGVEKSQEYELLELKPELKEEEESLVIEEPDEADEEDLSTPC